MTPRNYFGKQNLTLGSVVPLAMFQITPVFDNNIGLLLSHYSYIKSNHWARLLATCIPYVQDSAR